MLNFRDRSIRIKLTMIVMIATGVALVLAGVVFMVVEHYALKSDMVHDLEILGDIIGSNCTAAISFNNAADACEILTALQAEEHIIAAVVYGNEELVLAHYVRDDHVDDFKIPPVEIPGFRFTDNALSVSRTISLDTDRLGTIYIQSDLQELNTRRSQIGATLGLITLCCFLVVFVIVSRLQRVVSGPILKLAGAARVISDEKDYSVRVEHGSRDELGALVLSFNEMLTQIQQRDSALLEARNELEHRVQLRTSELQQEVVEHDRAKEMISASLKEKETLLKEIHHRVKNNLQIITSLLNLQASKIDDDKTRRVFTDSMGRVKSMALIHERLYQSEDLTEINFSDYVESLTKYLLSTTSGGLERISIKQEIDGTTLGVDAAVPCGLIINELVTNSMKYAFPNQENGEIIITFHRLENGKVVLSVSDNGVGIPAHIDIRNTQSLGMQLVHSLTDQLDGKLRLDDKHGTRFTIEFAREPDRKIERQHVTV